MLPAQYIAEHADALQSASGLYNVGLLALHNKQWGLARAALERAALLAPGDSATTELLRAARGELALALGALPMDPAETVWSWLAEGFNHPLSQILVAALILSAAISAWRGLRRLPLRRWPARPAAWGLIGAWLLVGICGGALWFQKTTWVGFSREHVVLRSGPGETFRELGAIEAGIKIRVLDTSRGDWVQTRFGTDAVGWAPRASILF